MVKVQTNSQGKVYVANGKALLSLTSGYNLRRVKDDNNNEIGTAYMEFEDANGNKYDVVCLDAVYRNSSRRLCSYPDEAITNLPIYSDGITSFWYDEKETATFNTQKILDFCTVNNYTSQACTHCRSQSFVINGTTYYGQLPNMRELWEIWMHRASIESMDITATSSTSTNFSTARTIWSSTQSSTSNMWNLGTNAGVGQSLKNGTKSACPILEIPK